MTVVRWEGAPALPGRVIMLATILEISGAGIALVALGYTAYSVGMSRKITRAEFWLSATALGHQVRRV